MNIPYFKKHIFFVFMISFVLLSGITLFSVNVNCPLRYSNDLINYSFKKNRVNNENGGKLENFNVEEYSESGRKEWEVKAATARVYRKIVKLTDVKGVSYGKNYTVTIEAKNGKFNKVTQDLQLRNDVVTTTSDGIKMITEKLNWMASREKAFTDKKVLVKNDKIEISGKGAKAKPNLEKIEFHKNVVTNIEPDTVIECKGPLKINYKKNTAVFNKDVVVEDKRGKIWADKITVYFNNKKKIKRIVAVGNVKVKRGKNITRSQRAEYIKKTNKVTFTGSPRLTIYPEEK